MRDRIDAARDYAAALSGPVPPYLDEIERRTHLETVAPQMLCGRLQGRLLSLLSQLCAPAVAVEIGTFTGYSACCLAEGLAPGGLLHTIEGNPEHASRARRNLAASPHADRVRLHLGAAADVLPTLPQQFDLVFLDGDKRGYPDYHTYFTERLRPGGLLIADNVLWDGRASRRERDPDVRALRRYNDSVAADDRLATVVLPLRDGLSVARRVSTSAPPPVRSGRAAPRRPDPGK